MKTIKRLTGVMLASALPLLAQTASADDYKIYHPNQCVPLGIQPLTSQQYQYARGYLEFQGPAGNLTFTCPAIRDQWGGTSGPDANFRAYDASTSRHVCCYIYSNDYSGGSYSSGSACTTNAAAPGWTDLYIPAIANDGGDGPYEVECLLMVGTRLASYWVGERPANE